MNSDRFSLICYLFVNHFLFLNNFQSLNFVDEGRLSLWGHSFDLLFLRLIIYCCVYCSSNKILCFYLRVIIFRALSDPKSRELKGKNGEEFVHMRMVLCAGFAVGYLTEKCITWSMCARGFSSAKYNIVPHSLPRNSIRICIRNTYRQWKNLFRSSFVGYIF